MKHLALLSCKFAVYAVGENGAIPGYKDKGEATLVINEDSREECIKKIHHVLKDAGFIITSGE